MHLRDYILPGWVDFKIKRKKNLGVKKVLLLSLDRLALPPIEGRKNLLCVDANDNLLWVAELPTEIYDSYVDMNFRNGVIHAESSNSFVAEIDPETGIILRTYMVK
ncbi:MAG TPA: hypothetical protein PK228_03825 [Saprospiraceae bacterium]|nr:hypothetical protein [Saprospiraceae bacterium]